MKEDCQTLNMVIVDNGMVVETMEELPTDPNNVKLEMEHIEINEHEQPNIIDNSNVEEEDSCIQWLPDYFKLVSRNISSVFGYVYSEEQLVQLLKLHSIHTHSVFIKHWRKTFHKTHRTQKHLNRKLSGLPKAHYFNRKIESSVFVCVRGKPKKKKDEIDEKLRKRSQSKFGSIKTGCEARIVVTQIQVFYQYSTDNLSRRQLVRKRRSLFEQLIKNPEKIESEICFKVQLPLPNAHTTHPVELGGYLINVLQSKVKARAESFIKQGICEMPVLLEMMNSYIERELFVEHDIPISMDVSRLYPEKQRIRNYMKKYIFNPEEKPGPSDSDYIRSIKQNFIDRIRSEARLQVPWLPDFFSVTEITEDSVSGWLSSTQDFPALKALCEMRTRSTMIKRDDLSAKQLVSRRKIHFSLAPIPINKHPFRVDDVQVYSCLYDQQYETDVSLMNTNLDCNAKIIAYDLAIYTDYNLPGCKNKIVNMIKTKQKDPNYNGAIEMTFVCLPLITTHCCHSIIKADIRLTPEEMEEKRRANSIFTQIISPKLVRGFDIVSNSCIVGELVNSKEESAKPSFISKKELINCSFKVKEQNDLDDDENDEDHFKSSSSKSNIVSVSLNEAVNEIVCDDYLHSSEGDYEDSEPSSRVLTIDSYITESDVVHSSLRSPSKGQNCHKINNDHETTYEKDEFYDKSTISLTAGMAILKQIQHQDKDSFDEEVFNKIMDITSQIDDLYVKIRTKANERKTQQTIKYVNYEEKRNLKQNYETLVVKLEPDPTNVHQQSNSRKRTNDVISNQFSKNKKTKMNIEGGNVTYYISGDP